MKPQSQSAPLNAHSCQQSSAEPHLLPLIIRLKNRNDKEERGGGKRKSESRRRQKSFMNKFRHRTGFGEARSPEFKLFIEFICLRPSGRNPKKKMKRAGQGSPKPATVSGRCPASLLLRSHPWQQLNHNVRSDVCAAE